MEAGRKFSHTDHVARFMQVGQVAAMEAGRTLSHTDHVARFITGGLGSSYGGRAETHTH